MNNLQIAQRAKLLPITDIAHARLGIPPEHIEHFGRFKAKISLDYLAGLRGHPDGRLVLVTAVSPTPAGEGKTTTTIGLGDALSYIGKRALICLREPALGPVFGLKGGATGGGQSQVAPMEDINLHFTGDFAAIAHANNLLAALIDNHIHFGNELKFDSRRIAWRRVVDINDRSLREVIVGLGGPANGYPREDGFDIVVASEVMAIFCLSESLRDLRDRLGRIVVGYSTDGAPILAQQLKAHGAMAVLLKQALAPNLVQTLENNPALIHGGPFANIAHGCNSVIATRAALKLADYVVTEAGFGADLGAEKFFDIKCRKAGFQPAATVLVATVRALKMHGGVAKDALGAENLPALGTGLANLARHIVNLRKFGLPVVVAINRFDGDTRAELAFVEDRVAREFGVKTVVCDHWARGGAGAEDLARVVAALADAGEAKFRLLYGDELSLWDKTLTIAREIYGAADIAAEASVRAKFHELEAAGWGRLPICVAKTQYSFSDDPSLMGAPTGHVPRICDVRLRAGAGFVVVMMGDIRTMPGLPRVPAAERIRIVNGEVDGLS